ncbi:hypothetical protein [Nonomuraea polychroma]|uniref:hypothetical protein n=1 Tax=Nonomuraea polychroma TaxID=46176 RepID=UPI0013E37F28|nr:hypothetical protein [Nonomuraea polychroma]
MVSRSRLAGAPAEESAAASPAGFRSALVPLTGQFWWAPFCATLLLGQEPLAIVPACRE